MLPQRVLLRASIRNVSKHPRTPLRTSSTQTSRLTRLESRLPRFLQRYTTPLRKAPLSHITAFLLLHELTAVIPLFGLAAIFHYTNWLPPYISEGAWVQQGIQKMGGWMRKKGWLEEEGVQGKWWGRGEGGVRVVVEFATAWAVTKALLPLRLVFSVWATPWFASRALLPVWRVARRWVGAGGKGGVGGMGRSPAAGTNAVGGRIGPGSRDL